MRRPAALVLALLMFAACSGDTPSRDADGNVLSLPQKGDGKGKKDGESSGHKRGEQKERPRTKKDDPGDDEDNTTAQSSASKGEPDAGKAQSGAGGLTLPVAGSYTYVQDGWEELCQASNCDREDLPPSQTVKVAYENKSSSSATFTSETRGSGSRTQTLTYEVRKDRAFINKLVSSFSSGAFHFTAEIVPDPPVVAGEFPLTVGDGWSGAWKDRNGHVDGSYSFEVAGRDRMTIDGRSEEVVVVDTVMKLSGDYRGTSEMRLWVIPGRFTVAASRGDTDIDSQYGTYRAHFTTSYSRGPSH